MMDLYTMYYEEYIKSFESDMKDDFLRKPITLACKKAAQLEGDMAHSGASWGGGSSTIECLKAFISGYKYAMGIGEIPEF